MRISRFKTRHNILGISSIHSFSSIKGGINHECKDVYFIRCIGSNSSYFDDIQYMDSVLISRERRGQGNYIRIPELPKLQDCQDIDFYTGVYNQWMRSQHKDIALKAVTQNMNANSVVSDALVTMQNKYERYFPNGSTTMCKNFMVKLMFWTDNVIGRLIANWSEKNTDKFVITGNIKKQEYLFCYFTTLLGIDVLTFMPQGYSEIGDELLALAMAITHPSDTKYQSDEKNRNAGQNDDRTDNRELETKEQSEAVLSKEEQITSGHNISEHNTSRHNTSRHNTSRHSQNENHKTEQNGIAAERNLRAEQQFEELALLAASVVMITVHDGNGKTLGTGSGIMVGKQGYILTNNHVANGGEFYSVRIEDDDVPYQTDELIKYNPILDLAVIRIDHKLNPIPIYRGEKSLVRGQKVVAIGSPLGLFNSVSNGIISGFRKIDDLDMIQFTAPISHGSSGGALLNTYGEVIGISTAGFDDGQNINLAVDYTIISDFIKGFV